MAVLALSVAGAAIGSSIGTISIAGLAFSGASLGFTLGSLAGQLLFPNNSNVNTVLPPQEGPRLGESRILTGTFGVPIPSCYGTMRIAGNVIWESPVQERKVTTTQTATTSSSAGKGGGSSTSTTSQTTTSYTYHVDIAIGICEGPITGINRIWADGNLIYDISTGATLQSAFGSAKIAASVVVYLGDETQLPDPIIEGWEGVGQVPAHRGLAYIMLNDFEIDVYGRRVPLLEFETHAAGSTAYVETDQGELTTMAPVDWPRGSANYAFGYHSGYIDDNGQLAIYLVSNVGNVASNPDNTQINIYKYSVYPGSIDATYTFHRQVTLPFPTSTTQQNRSLIGYSAVTQPSGFIDGITLCFLNNGGNAFTIIGSIDEDDIPYDTRVYVDLVNGDVIQLIHGVHGSGSNEARIINSAARWGPHLYAYVTNSNTTEGQATQGLYYWNLSNASNGSVVNGTSLVLTQPGIFKQPYLNADANGWFFSENSENNPSLGVGVHAYDHGTFNLQHSILRDRVGIPYRHDFDRQIYVLTDIGTDFEIIDPTGLIGSMDLGLGGGYQQGFAMPAYNVAAQTILFPNRRPPNPTQRFNWATWGNSGTIGSTTAQAIVNDVFIKAGLESSDYDTALGASIAVRGYLRNSVMTARAAIEPLAAAYFFDIIETGNQLKLVPRGSGGTLTIATNELAAHEYGSEIPDETLNTISEEISLPRRIVIKFYNFDQSYQQGTQHYSRLNTNIRNEVNVELPISLTPTEALQIAEKFLTLAWLERRTTEFTTTVKHLKMEPGDIVTLTGTNFTRTVKIANVTHRLPNLIEATATNYGTIESTLVAGAGDVADETEVSISGPTHLFALDIPLLRSADDGTGIYVTVNGPFSGWHGAVIYRSLDNGATWDTVDTLLDDVFLGTTPTAMPTVTNPNVWDRVNSIDITANDETKTLATSTETAVLAGANAALVGQADRWEIIHFVNATDNADGTWTIDTLLRGRGGTEQNVGNHAIGDQFILINPNATTRVPISDALIDSTILFRGVSIGTLLTDAITTSVSFTGKSNAPWAPTSLKGTRDGSDNITIEWLRRSRIIGRSLWVPLLGEATESYSIDILDGPAGSVVETYTATTETFEYLATAQTTDGFTPGDDITFKVYQVSATVGRGSGIEVTIT